VRRRKKGGKPENFLWLSKGDHGDGVGSKKKAVQQDAKLKRKDRCVIKTLSGRVGER